MNLLASIFSPAVPAPIGPRFRNVLRAGFGAAFALAGSAASLLGATPTALGTSGQPPAFFKKYCLECHDATKAKGEINLEHLLNQPSVGPHSDAWDKIVAMIDTREMPPTDAAELPTDTERQAAMATVRRALKTYETAHAGEPGRVTVRRLTSGEYAYAIRDLTGLDLKLSVDASSDSVGGEGFTNFGDVQFVQDATIERFLESAKLVANHAVIGAGPIQFYTDPGRTGLELSALARINDLYASKGFRVVSGEGGRPFGLERYGKAFFVAWYFQHRAALGDPKVTLRDLAAREGITGRFADHVWSVVNTRDLGYPSHDMVARWRALAPPVTGNAPASIAQARAGCEELYKHLTTWPSWFFSRGDLAAGGQGDESPLAFNDETLKATPTHSYVYPLGNRVGRGRFVRVTPGPAITHLVVTNIDPMPGVKPVVIWRNPRVITRAAPFGPPGLPPVTAAVGNAVTDAAILPLTATGGGGRGRGMARPILATESLRAWLPPEVAATLRFGVSLDGTTIGPDDFATEGNISFPVVIPDDGKARELQVDAEIGEDKNAVVRVMLSDKADGATRDVLYRVLLGDPTSAGYRTFRAGIAEYAALLPPNSHGEANPADKDPVPAPFDNTYNSPEHDAFVMKVKYQRSDRFFTDNLVDGAERDRLNHAWHDLFGSWPYHDAYLGMLDDHFNLKLKSRRMQDVGPAEIAALPESARAYVAALRAHYDVTTQAHAAAQPGHLDDALEFAARAWRRPVTTAEAARLRAFYRQARTTHALDHDDAVRALLARILVSPAFLYRMETVADRAERPLDAWERASRLSFFLWSSIPDAELRRAAAAGELSQPAMLARQVKRMTADPKARRLATEFFGQWLGFYRFDEFRGVDGARFPEFTDEVRGAMYDEAVSTFEYLVREQRPLKELLHADYTFLNQPLAKFYGIKREVPSPDKVVKIDGANAFNRGGALRLGSILTATSAPLRTSPVKRGDWLLRRILGTPTPPPPADAGSLPSDPKEFGGQTLRQRLNEHKSNPTCANCHLRIDPLGFPLEGFDAIGRTRDAYQDGTDVDVTGEFADKSTIVGANGLLRYLETKETQVMRTLAKKMVGYALGRTVLASDRALLDELTARGGKATFADLATTIVVSRQFLQRQGDADDPVSPTLSPAPAPTGGKLTLSNP